MARNEKPRSEQEVRIEMPGRLEEPSAAERYVHSMEKTGLDRSEGNLHAAGAHDGSVIPSGGGHTEDEYFALPDDVRVELIKGVFYNMAAPSRLHQSIILGIAMQLDQCLNMHRDTCFLYVAPSDVALGENRDTIVQPDLYVHCDREKDLAEGPYRGAPDLVVEVLSPSNPENDWWRKRDLYERCGVREYWIVNPKGRNVYVFQFGKDRKEGQGAGKSAAEPARYTFEDVVPVGISGGTCSVDFREIGERVRRFFE